MADTGAPEIEIEWTVKQKYIRTIDKDKFISWAKQTFHDLTSNPTLDDIYDRIDKGDHRATDFLIDLTDDKHWLDTDDASLLDLRELPS